MSIEIRLAWPAGLKDLWEEDQSLIYSDRPPGSAALRSAPDWPAAAG